MYDHLTYDIVPGREIVVQPPRRAHRRGSQRPAARPSDRRGPVEPGGQRLLRLLDLRRRPHDRRPPWYVDRFLALRETAFARPESYFHRYAALSDAEAVERAERIWDSINAARTCVQNILPTRSRATLVLTKGPRPRGASASGCAS